MRSPGRRRPVTDAAVAWVEAVRQFYCRPVAWAALLVSSALLTYGGGAIMFWFHAVVRGEQGPAISETHHWLLDSTLGFVALTPVLALIVPLGVWVARRGGQRAYVVAVAGLFAATTGPGPFLHGVMAGADAPLGRLAARVFGPEGAASSGAMHAQDRSPLTEGLLQVLVGLPVYLACTWLALRLVRGTVSHARRVAAGRAVARAVPALIDPGQAPAAPPILPTAPPTI